MMQTNDRLGIAGVLNKDFVKYHTDCIDTNFDVIAISSSANSQRLHAVLPVYSALTHVCPVS